LFKTIYLYLKLFLRWRSYVWLGAFRRDRQEKRTIIIPDDTVIDVMFLVVDHFEPARRDGDKAVEKVMHWCEKYREMAAAHVDSDGVHPQHSWFYRYDLPTFENIAALSRFVYNGFGEIEFHLHHGNDTPENFHRTIKEGVVWFNRTGAMLSAEENPKKQFAYIAGNWALDNGRRNKKFSGVNNEIEILSSLGCYADFTFPAFSTTAQPQKVNTLYYAKDTPLPKSYNSGVDLEVGKAASGDLMIFQGPLFVDWQNHFVDTAAFESFEPYQVWRPALWEKAHIHVKGRPEWIFIKLHTHGMQSTGTFLSDQFSRLCEDLEKRFKTPRYRLHYVSAREAYNIARAAEAGKKGNAHAYRDFILKQPVNKKILASHPFSLRHYAGERIHFTVPDGDEKSRFEFKESPLQSLGGWISEVDLTFKGQTLLDLKISGKGKGHISCRTDDSPSGEISLPFRWSA